MKKITIYTDGSSKGNPGPGGWAALVIYDRKVHKVFGNEPSTTNNRMELLAIIKGFEWVQKKFKRSVPPVTVRSDSNLVIKTMNEGWKTKKNLDLWEDLDRVTEGLTIKWEWVKGHALNRYNNECDRIAQEQADEVVGNLQLAASSGGDFFCEKCKKGTRGDLSQKTPDSPIRVDCTHCGKYIKFAPKTKENLKRTKSSQKSMF